MFSKKKSAGGDVCRKYKVVDYYDGAPECLGYADTLAGAKAIVKERENDTDGECDVVIKQKQPQGGYKAI